MDSAFVSATVEPANDFNLANYVPYRRSCNTVLYVHKKHLSQWIQRDTKQVPSSQETDAKLSKEIKKVEKDKVSKKKKKKYGTDIGIQFNCDDVSGPKDKGINVKLSNDSLLEQTVKFAKNLVPYALASHPSQDDPPPPVFYTIKATKNKKKPQKVQENLQQGNDVTYKKERSKKVIETYKHDKFLSQREESFSVKETVSYGSQSNTLDELHIQPPSLCCSFSDISEKKQPKKDKGGRRQNKDLVKFATSESFEALATELSNQNGETKVKIHLMNELDKNMFSESIRVPILNAIKECMLEISEKDNLSSEIVTTQQLIQCHGSKLDTMLERLAVLEKKMDDMKDKARSKSPNRRVRKPSTLETLGEDLIEIQESSEEETYQENLCERKMARSKSAVTQLTPEVEESAGAVNVGDKGMKESGTSSSLGPKPERSNRLPARFCWTDSRKV